VSYKHSEPWRESGKDESRTAWRTSARCDVSGTDVSPESPYLLDTNVIIDFLRGALDMDDLIRQFFGVPWPPMVSIVSKIELLGYPLITPHDESRIRHWLTRFEIVGLDERTADRTQAPVPAEDT
jgi:hypothetical protein